VFAISADGTGFTTLHDFAQPPEAVRAVQCMDNTDCPYGSTCLTDSRGIQICVQTNDGSYPNGGLILANNTQYGTTSAGGYGIDGTVFALNTDGSGFRNLHCFDFASGAFNSDGVSPYGGLGLSGNRLYGTARVGGSSGNGTVFAVNIDGTGFTILHSFTQLIIPCLNGSCPSGYHCVSGICVPIPVCCPGGCGFGYCVYIGDRDGNLIDCYCA